MIRLPEIPLTGTIFVKSGFFSAIANAARENGFHMLIDGTNASDDSSDRPGMKALRELSVYSPLRECGLTKDEIRRLSRQVRLFTWDKPAHACLATHIPTGEKSPLKSCKKQKLRRTFCFLWVFGIFGLDCWMAAQGFKCQRINFRCSWSGGRKFGPG